VTGRACAVTHSTNALMFCWAKFPRAVF